MHFVPMKESIKTFKRFYKNLISKSFCILVMVILNLGCGNIFNVFTLLLSVFNISYCCNFLKG